MSVIILPRRQRHHPTMQPIAVAAQKKVVNVRVPSSHAAATEYRAAAALLRDLDMNIAANILEITADALTDTVIVDPEAP